MTFSRSRTPEWMDDPNLSEEAHRQALAGLSRLNRVTAVSRVLYGRLVRYAQCIEERELRVLDVASGAGDLPVEWALCAKRTGLPIRVTTCDSSDVSVKATQELARAKGVQVECLQRDCVSDGLPLGFDVVTCSLFMHHLDEAQAIRLLQAMRAAATVAVLVCDLERSRGNLALVAAAARLVSRSPVVHHDAVASVRAAFTREEFSTLAERALTYPVPVKPLFPCRFLATIEELTVPVAVPAFA